ncbi:MAG: hypothetical protein ACRYFR_20900, partial [Janthinobacterium lividum]
AKLRDDFVSELLVALHKLLTYSYLVRYFCNSHNRLVLPAEVAEADPALGTYVREQIAALLERCELLDVLEGVLPPGSGYERKYGIERRLRHLLNKK